MIPAVMLIIVAINIDADNMDGILVQSETGKDIATGDARCFSPERTDCCRVHVYTLHNILNKQCL